MKKKREVFFIFWDRTLLDKFYFSYIMTMSIWPWLSSRILGFYLCKFWRNNTNSRRIHLMLNIFDFIEIFDLWLLLNPILYVDSIHMPGVNRWFLYIQWLSYSLEGVFVLKKTVFDCNWKLHGVFKYFNGCKRSMNGSHVKNNQSKMHLVFNIFIV